MPHLKDLTESILGQTHTDLDIVFSEGGSTDSSPEYLASITDPRVRVIRQEGTGAAGNWTNATEAAHAEFIKLVCQDDLLKPDAIAKQLADLTSNPQAVMAIAQRDIIDAKGQVLYPSRGCAGLVAGILTGTAVIKTCYLQGTNVLGEPVSVLFRTDPLKASLPWVDSNPLVLDLDMYAKVAEHGQIVVRKESVGAFRVSTSSWSTRLVKLQVGQYRRWQQEYAAKNHPTKAEQCRATVGLRVQATLRRAAYRWLSLKGSF
jgi:glycosyltransferase involved in cell wall biosynthesis